MPATVCFMIKAIGNIGRAALRTTSSLRATLVFASRVFLNLFDRRTYNSASRMVFIYQIYFTSVQILPLFLFVAVIFGSLINGMAFQVVKNLGLSDVSFPRWTPPISLPSDSITAAMRRKRKSADRRFRSCSSRRQRP